MFPKANGEPDPTNILSLGHVANPVQIVAGPAAYNNDLFYVDMDGGNIHRALLRPRKPAADRGREGDADEWTDPAHRLLQRRRLHRPAERNAHLQLELR